VPTLKILRGASIVNLVKAALEKMPELVGGASPKDDEESRAPQPPAPSVTVVEIVPPANDASSSSSGSGSPGSTPAPHSRGSVSTTPSSEEYLDKLEVRIETKAAGILEI